MVPLDTLFIEWFHLAGMYHGLPLNDRLAVEILADPTRPQVVPQRDRYVYFPGTAEIPETAAADIRNRSYSIAVEVDIDSPDATVCCSPMAPASAVTRCTGRIARSGTCTTSWDWRNSSSRRRPISRPDR
jgi:hypothetical protein